jgi:hypothetical protein
VEREVDVVKVMASGGMVTTGTDVYIPHFSVEELRLLVEQAHAGGLPVTAHGHAAAAADQAVAVGVEGIEHASYAIRSTGGQRQLAGRSETRAHSWWLQRGGLDRRRAPLGISSHSRGSDRSQVDLDPRPTLFDKS